MLENKVVAVAVKEIMVMHLDQRADEPTIAIPPDA